MLKHLKFPLLAAVLVAAPAFADDAALAAKLVGTWEGRWAFADMGGKVVCKIKSANGTQLKGETVWYDTAVGNFPDTFTKTKLVNGQLTVSESTMDFEGKVSEDGKSFEGTWTSPVASGKLTLTKKAE